ncbi:hypothetical protein VCHENC02_1623, partial [Vibrio harveyi]
MTKQYSSMLKFSPGESILLALLCLYWLFLLLAHLSIYLCLSLTQVIFASVASSPLHFTSKNQGCLT